MITNKREIMVFYHPASMSDRKTVAYAYTMSKHVKALDFDQWQTTGRSWQAILGSLDMHPKELFNKAHPEYQRILKGKELDDEGWLKVLSHYPHLIRKPIAVCGNKAVFCKTPTDIYRLS